MTDFGRRFPKRPPWYKRWVSNTWWAIKQPFKGTWWLMKKSAQKAVEFYKSPTGREWRQNAKHVFGPPWRWVRAHKLFLICAAVTLFGLIVMITGFANVSHGWLGWTALPFKILGTLELLVFILWGPVWLKRWKNRKLKSDDMVTEPFDWNLVLGSVAALAAVLVVVCLCWIFNGYLRPAHPADRRVPEKPPITEASYPTGAVTFVPDRNVCARAGEVLPPITVPALPKGIPQLTDGSGYPSPDAIPEANNHMSHWMDVPPHCLPKPVNMTEREFERVIRAQCLGVDGQEHEMRGGGCKAGATYWRFQKLNVMSLGQEKPDYDYLAPRILEIGLYQAP